MKWQNKPNIGVVTPQLIDNPCPEYVAGCPSNYTGFCLVDYSNHSCTSKNCVIFFG